VSAALGCKAAEGLTKLGQEDEALNMLKQVEAQFQKAIRPKQLRALALARRAAKTKNAAELAEAQDILAELYAAGHHDPETVGIYARTWMDRYDIDGNELSLRRSRDLYAEAFAGAQDDYYTGINAAAKSVFLGAPDDLKKADEYAARVLEIVGTTPTQGDYWKTATSAEALLMRKKYPEAAALYQAAVVMAPSETGSHGSTWKQASRLMAKLGTSPEDRALVRKPFSHIPEA
jgi:tetratricopeptide (TPR) repeat protein